MKSRRILALVPLLVLWGCGGSSGGGVNSLDGPTATTREHVSSTRNFGVGAMLHSGVQNASFATAMNGGPAPGGMGRPAPAPMLGGFLRHLPPEGLLRPHPAGGGGGVTPPDPWPMPTFYFDEWLGLWVQVQITETSNRMDFFVDEAKTQPAGHMLSTWPRTWGVYPVSWHSDYEFTAGTMNGSHGTGDSTMTSETSGNFSYDDTWSGNRYHGSSAWSEQGTRWTNRTDNSDGSWSNDSGDYAADGSGTTVCENSLGYRSTFHWNADGSGNGRIEGPDPGLPAIIAWDGQGMGTITYADGTTEEYHWWSIVEPVGTGSGGSGEGSSGGAPPPPGGGMGL